MGQLGITCSGHPDTAECGTSASGHLLTHAVQHRRENLAKVFESPVDGPVRRFPGQPSWPLMTCTATSPNGSNTAGVNSTLRKLRPTEQRGSIGQLRRTGGACGSWEVSGRSPIDRPHGQPRWCRDFCSGMARRRSTLRTEQRVFLLGCDESRL